MKYKYKLKQVLLNKMATRALVNFFSIFFNFRGSF